MKKTYLAGGLPVNHPSLLIWKVSIYHHAASMVTPLSYVFFRAFFGVVFGLVAFYFLIWAILSSTVPQWEAVLRFSASAVLSGLGSVYFMLIHWKSDVYLPKTQSMLFYSFSATFSLLMGLALYLHIESYQAIPERMRIPTQILAGLIYLVFFIFSLIRVSEARFLPSLSKARFSDELIK